MASQNDASEPRKLTQAELDDLAQSLEITYAVLDNLSLGHSVYKAELTICNRGETKFEYNNWSLYFNHIRMIEPPRLPNENGILLTKGLHLQHINGCLFRMQPTKEFSPLEKGQTIYVSFRGQYYSVARCDVLPNWYLTAGELEPRIISCTAGEKMNFVAPFDTPAKWKRFDYVTKLTRKQRIDFHDPFTPEVRFARNLLAESGTGGQLVVPTPVVVRSSENAQTIEMRNGKWKVVYDDVLEEEARYLTEKIGGAMSLSDSSSHTGRNTIILSKREITLPLKKVQPGTCSEAYHLNVDSTNEVIEIQARERVGAFWGIQTLLGLADAGCVPAVEIQDMPRYSYRGMHLDVSRNFHSKDTVLRLLEVMSMYKMNKLHFHVTDDEGWRLQIPGLEELTEVGSRRCHTILENTALLPLLGSGPFDTSSGTGFYTVDEYREILRYATRRYIEVIPEIDMPGHCHAAVRAMQARYEKLKAVGDLTSAEKYLLSDLSADVSIDSQSVQMFSENSLNPGLPSTFEFIRKVVSEIQKMHSDICPLRMLNYGGDEVPFEAWEDSPACHALLDAGEVLTFHDLMEYFVVKVSNIAKDLGLEVGAWQDGVMHKFEEPFARSSFPNDVVTVYAWKNVWETGMAFDIYKLANSGYKVVLCPGTHLYFDHPQEPDPEERGLYWACRYADTKKVFSFAPGNLFSNADMRLTGEPFSHGDVDAFLEDSDFEALRKEENVIGLQGQLWSELVRTSGQLDEMIFPRLLALAERAWHEAAWEGRSWSDKGRDEERTADWSSFASRIGCHELSRLDRLGIEYYLPPPGGRITDGCLQMNCQLPGLPLEFSYDSDQNWTRYGEPVQVNCECSVIFLRTCSVDCRRHSRIITVKHDGSAESAGQMER